MTASHFRSSFAAMGTTAQVVVVGDDASRLHTAAVMRVHDLEYRWSRFIEHSEVSQLNREAGSAVRVSSDTIRLVSHGVAASRLTGGTFDPTLGDALCAHGYDRPFDELCRDASPTPTSSLIDFSNTDVGAGCTSNPNIGNEIEIDERTSTVRLPAGTTFDAGGFGKGFAADIISHELEAAGARGSLVNLGGDLVVRGQPPQGDQWVVEIREPSVRRCAVTTIALTSGAVATSTTQKRRWSTANGRCHHLFDSTTRQPAVTDIVMATVIAGTGWWAEAAATSWITSGGANSPNASAPDAALSVLPVLSVLSVRSDGSIERQGRFSDYEQ